MPTKKTRKPKNWKDINQAVKPKEMSDVARRQLVAKRLKVMASAILVVALIVGLAKITVFSDRGAELIASAIDPLPVKHVEIHNGGVLTNAYVLDYLGLKGEVDLMRLDLVEMRGQLLELPQVTEATIQRELPDSLIIAIEEREPIVRLLARDATGDVKTLLVDGTGVVYEGIGYDERYIRSLPALGGVVLKREEGGFERIGGIDQVDELLTEAKLMAPHLYRSWKVVSLERAPQLIVRSKMAREVVFNPGSFRKELARLDYIIDHYKGQMVTELASIDLTLGAQVPVLATTVQ